MISIVDRLLGRPVQAQPTQTREDCCGGHGKSGHHAPHEGADHPTGGGGGGCCGGHGHRDTAPAAAPEAPVETAGNRFRARVRSVAR